jgi:hypothetical protein
MSVLALALIEPPQESIEFLSIHFVGQQICAQAWVLGI